MSTNLKYLKNCPVCNLNLSLVSNECLDVIEHNKFYENVLFKCPSCDVEIEIKIYLKRAFFI